MWDLHELVNFSQNAEYELCEIRFRASNTIVLNRGVGVVSYHWSIVLEQLYMYVTARKKWPMAGGRPSKLHSSQYNRHRKRMLPIQTGLRTIAYR